MEEAVALFLD